jgi:mannitol/fructose-specific phosphotransferase system IIA component (Ntr-type)
MRLSQYLREDLVLTDLTAPDLPGVLAALADHLAGHGAVPSRDEVERGLTLREKAHTTCMGHGMALPHATIGGLERPVLMVALAPRAIQFGPDDTEPVRLFFVLLSPPGREGEHIKLLARICRLVRHPGFVEDLMSSEGPGRVLDTIRRVDEEHV